MVIYIYFIFLSIQAPNLPPLVKMKSRDDIRFTSGWGRTVKLLDLVRSRLITESRIIEIETEQVRAAYII